jgi:hypothetical protein
MLNKKTLKKIGVPRNKWYKNLPISNEKAIATYKFFSEQFKDEEKVKSMMKKDHEILSISKEKFKRVREIFSEFDDDEFKDIVSRCPRILKRSTLVLSKIFSILSEFDGKMKEIMIKEPSIFLRRPSSIKEKINELKLYGFQSIALRIPSCICSYGKEKLKEKLEFFKDLNVKTGRDFLLQNPLRIMFNTEELKRRLEIVKGNYDDLFITRKKFYKKYN